MTTGFMWLDDHDDVPLATRLLDAVRYYHRRYGHWPNRCEVPAGTVPNRQDVLLVDTGHVLTLLPVGCLPARHWFLYRQEDEL